MDFRAVLLGERKPKNKWVSGKISKKKNNYEATIIGPPETRQEENGLKPKETDEQRFNISAKYIEYLQEYVM